MPPFYKDLAKPSVELFSDDFSLKRVLKVKHTTPNGVSFTTENEHKKGVTGKVSAKYAHKPSGFSLDKISISPDGFLAMESSVKDIAPGLRLTAKTDQEMKGDIGLEYVKPQYTVASVMDMELSNLKTSAVMTARNGVNAGAEVKYQFAGEKASELKDYNAAISCFMGKGYWAALTSTNKMSNYTLSAMFSPAKDTVAGIQATAAKDALSSPYLTVGGLYRCNPKTTMKAKVTSDGILSGLVSQTCAAKMLVNVTGQVDVREVSSPRFGLSCTLG